MSNLLQKRYGLVFDFTPTHLAISYNTLTETTTLKMDFTETGISPLEADVLYSELRQLAGADVIIGFGGSCIAFFPLEVSDV